jgi:dTDP-4-dehydrorhamnose 3,5-epimerase
MGNLAFSQKNLGLRSEMIIEHFQVSGVKLLTPKIFRDERGFFSETFNEVLLLEHGIDVAFVQDNHSLSVDKGVVRGLHFQTSPHAQDKLIRVSRGAIFDVAVDIRTGSPTFGSHVSTVLSADNWCQLWVPAGFAHGFCTLEPNTEVQYKVSAHYDPDCERGLSWNDPDLGIEWPVAEQDAILSDKDKHHPKLSELTACFLHSSLSEEATLSCYGWQR